jgi:hypothetical protein
MVMRSIWVTLCILILAGCKDNELLVNAPPKDMLTVFGILNASDSVHHVRVGRLFLPPSDAVKAAQNHRDLVEEAVVTLTGGDTVIYFSRVDTLRADGLFPKDMTVFRGLGRLKPNTTYRLEVSLPGGLKARARTTVPNVPAFLFPPETFVYQGNIEGWYPYNFQAGSLSIGFGEKRRGAAGNQEVRPSAYEVRFFFRYGLVPGVFDQEIVYGPTGPPFSGDIAACPQKYGASTWEYESCFNVGRGFLNYLLDRLPPGQTIYTDLSPFNTSTRIEITAIDTFLYNYMRANAPNFEDFTTVRPEYTNVEGGLGVLGSVVKANRYVHWSDCARYLARLNDTPRPSGSCQ